MKVIFTGSVYNLYINFEGEAKICKDTLIVSDRYLTLILI